MKIIRHGELLLIPTTLPKGSILEKESYDDIIAHSETGHHHIIEVKEKSDMSKMKFYTFENDRYVDVPQMAELWHQKTGLHVHKTLPVVPAVYKINKKKEFDYFKGILRQVRD
ncbi:hypothetical protein EKK58_06130 [Candidatus Dependentiae bacterium]|nr:MAG: hypothetical protein EKK58_06130 [Candidatus Dependentiae bacterium]